MHKDDALLLEQVHCRRLEVLRSHSSRRCHLRMKVGHRELHNPLRLPLVANMKIQLEKNDQQTLPTQTLQNENDQAKGGFASFCRLIDDVENDLCCYIIKSSTIHHYF